MNLWEIEREIREQGAGAVCGVDEAGRGPLAGNVYAGAVILPYGIQIEGLNDSKKLSEKTRERLYAQIIENAVAYAIGIATVEEIDGLNILNATFLAMNRAVSSLSSKPDFLLVDGDKAKGFTVPVKTVVKGDSKCASIAAASILAKVSRDRYMLVLDSLYPEYNFKKHKGYGTKEHIKAVLEFGASPVHRKSFLKKVTER